MSLSPDAVERLAFLARVVKREVALLQETCGLLFGSDAIADAPWRLPVGHLPMLFAERLDAFVARFARLQDTVGDKLLPALLVTVAEPVGAAIDNLNRAERFGWLGSVELWRSVRALRNQMIHEYVEDRRVLESALIAARDAVPMLCETAERLCDEAVRRIGEKGSG